MIWWRGKEGKSYKFLILTQIYYYGFRINFTFISFQITLMDTEVEFKLFVKTANFQKKKSIHFDTYEKKIP